MAIKQIETAFLASHSKVSLPERSRTHHQGSNNGDTIPNVEVVAFDHADVWHMTVKDKKAFYGKKHLVTSGNKPAGEAGSAHKRMDDTVEPVCWHPMSPELYEDLVDGFFVKLVFDLVAQDMMLAWVSLKKRVAYVGITFTAEGTKMARDWLFEKMKVLFQNEEI